MIDNNLRNIGIITRVYRQQHNYYNSRNVKESIPNRIVSINKPYICPIVRGKETKTVEFVAKCNNILVDGISFIEKLSLNAFSEGIRLPHCIKLSEKLFQTKVNSLAVIKAIQVMLTETYAEQTRLQHLFLVKTELIKKKNPRGKLVMN